MEKPIVIWSFATAGENEKQTIKLTAEKIAKVEKISKRVKEEMARRNKKEKEEKEKEKSKGAEAQKQADKKPGFARKFFRRKSI